MTIRILKGCSGRRFSYRQGEVVDVNLKEFITNLHEDRVVKLEERKLCASRRHSIRHLAYRLGSATAGVVAL